jgi:hypothetical protein
VLTVDSSRYDDVVVDGVSFAFLKSEKARLAEMVSLLIHQDQGGGALHMGNWAKEFLPGGEDS